MKSDSSDDLKEAFGNILREFAWDRLKQNREKTLLCHADVQTIKKEVLEFVSKKQAEKESFRNNILDNSEPKSNTSAFSVASSFATPQLQGDQQILKKHNKKKKKDNEKALMSEAEKTLCPQDTMRDSADKVLVAEGNIKNQNREAKKGKNLHKEKREKNKELRQEKSHRKAKNNKFIIERKGEATNFFKKFFKTISVVKQKKQANFPNDEANHLESATSSVPTIFSS